MQGIDLWIYSEDFVALGIVDTYNSLIWANRFRQCGDFEIYVSISTDLVELLQEGRWVVRPDDDMVGIIETVKIGTDEENGDFLQVSGRCLRQILGRRIIWDQTELSGSAENGLRKLVNDAIISPEISARKYDKLVLAEAHGYTETVSAQYTGDNLREAVESICASKNYGFKITMETAQLVLDFYKGTNRAMSQHENPRVIFSEDNDNLRATTYTLDSTNYKTVALVAGEGEGKKRKRVAVELTEDTEGLHRRELYVDARDLSSEDGEISAEDYEAQLADRGATGLSEAPIVQSMEGTIEPMQMYAYKQDYFLGDIVTVVNKYGVAVDTQVLEVVEVWDEDGYTCTPTFG